MTAFLKMHGLGNDFVVFDARDSAISLSTEQLRKIADRHFGVGCDQFIVLEPARPGADVFMRIRNPDGGELDLAWRDDGHVLMTGPVATAFRGQIELPQ